MSLEKDLANLQTEGIITPETGEKIRQWYAKKDTSSNGRLLTLFGILGAMLVGLGVILVVAHNWDNFNRPVRTFFALLPMTIGQIACLLARMKFGSSKAWLEGSSVFLTFAVGAAIAIVSQIYHLGGELDTFVMVWFWLTVPLVYLMHSSATSLLCIVAATAYAQLATYSRPAYPFILMIAALLPHYVLLTRRSPDSNFTIFHHWLIPLSISLSLYRIITPEYNLMTPAHLAWCGVCLSIGVLMGFREGFFRRSYEIIGSIGTIWTLLITSFGDYWERWSEYEFFPHPPTYIVLVIIAFYFAGLVLAWKREPAALHNPLLLSFTAFLIILVLNTLIPVGQVLVNVLVLAAGLMTILRGARINKLSIMNFGMIIITLLVICRFFDTDLSFIVRGLLFIAVGTGFFLMNYITIKKRKANG